MMKCKRKILIGLYCIGLAGCGCDNQDLLHYIRQVNQKKSQSLPPMPRFKFRSALDNRTSLNRRDPFKRVDFPQQGNLFTSKQRRFKRLLLKDALNKIQFMGTLRQEQQIWALVKGTKLAILSVQVGDCIGKTQARIVSIKPDLLQLEETQNDSLGGSKKHIITMSLHARF